MMNVTDKRHWYDGWIYDRILAPNQKVPFRKIRNLIRAGSSVADIGCGTGRLAFMLADKCNSILGIDLSEKNIRTAKRTSELMQLHNLEFVHSDLASIKTANKKIFDYSVLSYVLHEVNRNERIKLLNDAAAISDLMIISDHKPETTLITSIIREVLELGAGMQHYLNYRSFINDGGIKSIAGECGLTVVSEEVHSSHLHIVVLHKQ